MTSPLLFGGWAEAEAVMLEGKHLLDAIHDRAESARNRRKSAQPEQSEATKQVDANDWESRLQHGLRVAFVWILGARLPRYVVQMVLFLLVLTMVLDPRMEIMVSAACIILLWSVIYAFATLLDVRLMLRLRMEQPAAHSHGAAIAAPRSDERRAGKECVSTCRSRWSQYH